MKTFITIVFILFVLRWLLKPFIKFTVQTTINKMAGEAMKRQQQYQEQQRKAEGTISVDYIPVKGNTKKPNPGNKGDYVDYEEVK
ncbi:MAG TPA: DUF4834 family protein [Cytophagaceae bacterium]|jgi:hypothetical protein|nr:DUF4834 family protein [Cytophagaceae bacterium]